MKILTHLSKEKINSIAQLEKSYNFYIDIDNKKYEATLYGYLIEHRALFQYCDIFDSNKTKKYQLETTIRNFSDKKTTNIIS